MSYVGYMGVMGYIHIFTIRRAKLKLILFTQPRLRFLVTILVSWVAVTARQTTNYLDPVQDSGFSIQLQRSAYSIFTSLIRYYSDNIFEFKI